MRAKVDAAGVALLGVALVLLVTAIAGIVFEYKDVSRRCKQAGFIGFTLGGRFVEEHCIDRDHRYVRVPR